MFYSSQAVHTETGVYIEISTYLFYRFTSFWLPLDSGIGQLSLSIILRVQVPEVFRLVVTSLWDHLYGPWWGELQAYEILNENNLFISKTFIFINRMSIHFIYWNLKSSFYLTTSSNTNIGAHCSQGDLMSQWSLGVSGEL